MQNIIEKAKARFRKTIDDYGEDPYLIREHPEKVEYWARFLLERHSEADEEVVLLAVWLHDVGHYPVNDSEDHAVTSERIAAEFLKKEGLSDEKAKKVLHCVRAHRAKDVAPESIEAKIIACADSASHFSGLIYFDIARSGRTEYALSKLDRDYRDLSYFPEVKKKLEKAYKAFKEALKACADLDKSE